MRLVGSGLGSSPGCGGFLSLSQTRLPSLRKGKDSCSGVRGEVRGSGGSAGEEGSGSDILTCRRFVLFFFCLCLLVFFPGAHKEEEDGGLHLLHGNNVYKRWKVLNKEASQVERSSDTLKEEKNKRERERNFYI